MNEVRIIAGSLRGRKIHFQAVNGLRPTLDRVRETLFNWLMFKIRDAVCLDAFSGSGALGFEALSRGAAQVDFIEQNPSAILELNQNQKKLQLEGHSRIIEASALSFLAVAPPESYDLIFLDPPFQENLVQESLQFILDSAILKPGGVVYFEAEKRLDLALKAPWILHRHKTMGDVQFGLLEIFC
ncbi:MAG: 16S rRNA (guanine(966)-N(2))-methyltransferase RsmD [Gammaproteobacteria bacterium]|nr:16S rRNA (guanine(966)-N(2))-methyltransferase RsmD [Gammaproteobacteria bacterium]